jgi:hypothetical protein
MIQHFAAFKVFKQSITRGCTAVWLTAAILPVAMPAAAESDKGYLSKAATGEGFLFQHHEWEIACDNTRTCRAAGYHPEPDELKISVLLTRAAGPDTPVKGALKIGQYGDDPVVDKLPVSFNLSMQIDGQPLGQIRVQKLAADLPSKQLTVLIDALLGTGRIEFVYGPHRWHLSGQGATAALLKMDEFQGRIGTPGALARKGAKSEQSVRPPQPIPTVASTPLPKPHSGDENFITAHARALVSELRKSTDEDSCPLLFAQDPDTALLSVARLSDSQMLLTAICDRFAYNQSGAAWIIRTSPPFKPINTNTQGTELEGNQIWNRMKGRGLGDCWSSDAWTWNGKHFAPTHASTTGMCKMMSPDGAWQLPVWTTTAR